jgi:hypothetical protein
MSDLGLDTTLPDPLPLAGRERELETLAALLEDNGEVLV